MSSDSPTYGSQTNGRTALKAIVSLINLGPINTFLLIHTADWVLNKENMVCEYENGIDPCVLRKGVHVQYVKNAN